MVDVLALGSVMVEITPPEGGVSLREARELVALPGGASLNFAAALAKLDVRAALATAVGEDEWGEWLCDRMREMGVDTLRVRRVSGQLTTVSFCWVDRQGGKRFYFYRAPGHSDPMGALAVEDICGDGFAGARIFDFGEAAIRNQPLRDVAFESARRARTAGLQVCYAVNYRPASWSESRETVAGAQREACSLADIAVMNREEASLIAGTDDVAAATEVIARLGPSVVAVTGGEEGTLVRAGGEAAFVPPRRVTVLYDVGAGDVFHAGLLAGLLSGMTPPQAARLGSDAAALWISRPADIACLPTRDEVTSLPPV
jgi:5-dehydro-2-deoxygluconokinase